MSRIGNRIKQAYLKMTTFKWIVGIAEFNPDAILSPTEILKVQWIRRTPKGSWFADPFILKETKDHLHILVEEFLYKNNKGRISKIVVNKHNWKLEQVIPVIDIPTHLSFPVHYRKDGKVYIYPESTKSGKLTVYEYDEETDTVIQVKDICSRPIADAVIYDLGRQKVIMATTSPKDNGKVLDIYPLADDPADKPLFSIPFLTNVARNAGIPFSIDGRAFRPAQDCTHHYGSCVVLQEMTEHDGTIYFKEIKRFKSPSFNYKEAFHTFNVFDNKLIAVDAEGFRYGLLAQAAYHIRELLRK